MTVVEDNLESCIDQMILRMAALENTVASQNTKIDKNIADMFEAIRLLAKPGVTLSTSDDRTQSRPPPTPTFVAHDPTSGTRSSLPLNYDGITRLAKLDFPRFSGAKVKEWLFKVEQFFAIDHTSDEIKVLVFLIHLDDTAATWHQSLLQSD